MQGSTWLGAPTLAFLTYMAFAWKDPSPFQKDVARLVAAVTAGLLAYVIAGSITLRWKPTKGMAVSASSGFALFVLVAFVPQTKMFPIPPPQACERWSVVGTLTFLKSDRTSDFAPNKDSIHLLIHPPEPTWSDFGPRKIGYTLPILMDPRDLPKLQIESANFFPKTFQLSDGKHDDDDPYTVVTDPKQRTITISAYALQGK